MEEPGNYLVPINPDQRKDEIVVRNAPNVRYQEERHLYNRTHLDLVWTVDFTFINGEAWAFFVMDLASKKILDFEVKEAEKKFLRSAHSLLKKLF